MSLTTAPAAATVFNLVNLLLQFLDGFAFLVLAAVGLVVIFGMMGIINLAHGEFILVGAYSTTLIAVSGVPFPVAVVAGTLITAVFGILLERSVLKRFYERPLDSMVATWAISLMMIQGTRIFFGNTIVQADTPFGAIEYGQYSYSGYQVFLSLVSIGVLAGIYILFTRTDFGLKARATIQDVDTAKAMGINTERIYVLTFGFGSGLAGLTGALYAPTLSMSPGVGQNFLVEAFVAVVVGGSSVVMGTSLAGILLGAISAFFSNVYSTFWGRIALLVAAIIAIRLMPNGITGVIENIRERRDAGMSLRESLRIPAITFFMGGGKGE
jgi:branched-chain amino acid transport system permease protein